MPKNQLSSFMLILSLAIMAVAGCSPYKTCPITEPEWVLPPDDSAVQSKPAFGYYYMNEDRSIWASAWWYGLDENYLTSGQGIKMGWFRPEGVDLEISGRRLDGDALALEASIPCCYPTRFQATGLTFPIAGCWEVTARAGDKSLKFVVEVE